MNYPACWRGKEALIGKRCLTINTQANRIAIVSSVITRILQVLGSHISTHSVWGKLCCSPSQDPSSKAFSALLELSL